MISAVIVFKDGSVTINSSNVESTSKTFPSGFFNARENNKGLTINKETLPEIHTPYNSRENKIILRAIQSFFNKDVRERINKLGYLHKLGILLYGRAGTGKTSMLNYCANKMAEKSESIVFLCNDGNSLSTSIALAKKIRKIQNNTIIFICDEFERFAKNAESEMKNFLDGKDSIDNMLFLAATNYIDEVPDTIKNRSSRFKIVEEIKGIDEIKSIEEILKERSQKLNPGLFTEKEIKQIAKSLCPCTLDEIKNKIIEKTTNFFVPNYNRKKIGFSVEKEEEERSDEYPGFLDDFGPLDLKDIL